MIIAFLAGVVVGAVIIIVFGPKNKKKLAAARQVLVENYEKLSEKAKEEARKIIN